MAVSTLNTLSICAGVGGLELGLMLAHWHRGQDVRGVCYVEREGAAAASLVTSMEAGWLHPAPVWSDARTFDGRRFAGLVDIVTSGDPCQGNSVAGKRLGQLDDRWLLDRAIDIFDQSGAPRFFRENVPGNADGQLAVAIPALERLGCRIAVGIFSAAETGNTMRRERLFILAERDMARAGGERSRHHASSAANRGRRSVDSGSAGVRSGDGEERADRTDATGSDGHRALVRPEGVRSGEGGSEHAGQQGRSAASGAGCELEHTVGRGRGREDHARQPSGLAAQAGARLRPAVIPGPSDTRGWIDVLDRWPELQPALSEEEAQSHLRRGIDAMADRIERLRACGNGVDPVAAATAYLSLDALLAAGAGAGAASVRIAA